MKALVTGGAGFIGSHIVHRLVESGHHVRVADNFTTGKRENLRAVERDVEIVSADVRDRGAMRSLASGCDVIFHQAAIVSVPYSVEHPEETNAVNIQGTLHVLLAARHANVRRVVFASSAAIYGDEPTMPKCETMLPDPVSPYGVEKLASEHYLRAYHRLHGVETVALRYFNVFGPRQDPSSPYSGVVSVFARRVLSGEPLTIFGDGTQSRDFVYVANVVDANLAAANAQLASGRVYNIACGKNTTLLELADALGRAAHAAVKKTFAPSRPGDIKDSLADITRAHTELGYTPRISVDEGLHLFVQHLRDAHGRRP